MFDRRLHILLDQITNSIIVRYELRLIHHYNNALILLREPGHLTSILETNRRLLVV